MPPAGVNVEVGLPVLLNCDVEVLGPLCTDQLPVPTPGLFALSAALPVTQMVWLLPALAGVGFRLKITTVSLTELQGPFAIVHTK